MFLKILCLLIIDASEKSFKNHTKATLNTYLLKCSEWVGMGCGGCEGEKTLADGGGGLRISEVVNNLEKEARVSGRLGGVTGVFEGVCWVELYLLNYIYLLM